MITSHRRGSNDCARDAVWGGGRRGARAGLAALELSQRPATTLQGESKSSPLSLVVAATTYYEHQYFFCCCCRCSFCTMETAHNLCTWIAQEFPIDMPSRLRSIQGLRLCTHSKCLTFASLLQSGSTLHAQLEIWKMAYADQPAHQQHSQQSASTDHWPASYAMPHLDLDYNEDSEGEFDQAKTICIDFKLI